MSKMLDKLKMAVEKETAATQAIAAHIDSLAKQMEAAVAANTPAEPTVKELLQNAMSRNKECNEVLEYILAQLNMKPFKSARQNEMLEQIISAGLRAFK